MLEMVALRAEIASEIGMVKEKDGLAIRDTSRENEVLNRFLEISKSIGLSQSAARGLAELLIEDAVRAQRNRPRRVLDGKSALVVGGSGKMGEWTCRFLSNRGAKVRIWDSRAKLEGYQSVQSIAPFGETADFIIVAGPLGTCPEDLKAVFDCSPKGIVFDLCSVKSHIHETLKEGASKGLLVTSVHPMFGPSAASPKGRNVIVCDCGCPRANQSALDLFKGEGAAVSEISLDRHDELMAYVLGLSHLCSLLFAGTLVRSGKSVTDLGKVQGTSFMKMTKMARELSNESKRVYHDIQSLNPHTRHMIATMEAILRELKKASLDANPDRFGKIMESEKKFLEV